MTEEEIARKIENAVNTFADLQKVGELLAKKGHPTLQQNFAKVMIGFIKQQAERYEKGWYDLRNKSTAELCYRIWRVIKGNAYFPLI